MAQPEAHAEPDRPLAQQNEPEFELCPSCGDERMFYLATSPSHFKVCLTCGAVAEPEK